MEDRQKVHIGGIKFSEELIQVTVVCKTADDPAIYQLLQSLAEKSINIPFLCHSGVNGIPESSFCVARSELGNIQQVLNLSSIKDEHVNIIQSVGTLTLFPHRNSFKLLGLILHFFGIHKFPVHSLSTSISAIALNTSYVLLDEISSKLLEILKLPENHAPFRSGFRLTQIQL
jgi:hypothetical protein